ncbi:hypothetical protein [Vibrio maritimus]|uniref:hypothetical protein n=1 Tax=Vibrio maritimus TaxID=990268 RepID=UPI001F40C5FB|nr:hypothetical protein [Vibrio maritimus]
MMKMKCRYGHKAAKRRQCGTALEMKFDFQCLNIDLGNAWTTKYEVIAIQAPKEWTKEPPLILTLPCTDEECGRMAHIRDSRNFCRLQRAVREMPSLWETLERHPLLSCGHQSTGQPFRCQFIL